MQTRTVALIAVSAAAVAVTVTGVTYASADSPRSASSGASAPLDGDHNWKDDGSKKDSSGQNSNGGNIQVNERTYSSDPGACVAVVRPAGTSFNITNNTTRTVQFFSGNNCDAGVPIAAVGPGGTSFGVVGTTTSSFRVID